MSTYWVGQRVRMALQPKKMKRVFIFYSAKIAFAKRITRGQLAGIQVLVGRLLPHKRSTDIVPWMSQTAVGRPVLLQVR